MQNRNACRLEFARSQAFGVESGDVHFEPPAVEADGDFRHISLAASNAEFANEQKDGEARHCFQSTVLLYGISGGCGGHPAAPACESSPFEPRRTHARELWVVYATAGGLNDITFTQMAPGLK